MSTTAGTAGQVLDQERAVLDAALRAMAAEDVTRDAAGPLAAALEYALASGGKRLRGALCVLAYRTLDGRAAEPIHQVAAAVELVHTYSLIHDDLPCMDDDDLRRGRPTLHRVFGSAAAAVAGAALIPLAFRVLQRGAHGLGLGEDAKRGLALMLARAIGAGGMVGGQWLDLEAEGRGSALLPDELARIHSAKTGALFEAALAMGGLAAGGATAQVEALGRFGAGLGLAFQVVDDLLDESGDAASLGKTAGKDRRQDKATFPALLGPSVSRERARAAVDRGLAHLRAAGIARAELEAVGEWVLARHH